RCSRGFEHLCKAGRRRFGGAAAAVFRARVCDLPAARAVSRRCRVTLMNERHDRPWSVAVRVDDVPEQGRHLELEASAEVRAALAQPVGVDAIEQLTASFDLAPRGRDGLQVSGTVRARVRQTCIVTLEPVINAIEEEVAVDYA